MMYEDNKLYLSQQPVSSMNFRENNYPQSYDEVSRNFISNSAVAKFNQAKSKKKSLPMDKERLYEENFDLKSRVKELEEMNLKLKTQLTVAEKEKQELFSMAEQEVLHQKLPQRSQSGAHKMSVGNPLEQKSNFTLLKEKQNLTFKKLVREKHNEIERLKLENANIKKTMKFTRLNELLTENNELIDETKRLKMQILEARSYTDQFNTDYSNRIESLKRELQQERQGEKRNGVELKKQREVVAELMEKLRQTELKKVEAEKRLTRENKLLRAEITDLRSKLIAESNGKQCDRPECAKNRKQKAELKRKTEQLQKQIKTLNDDLLQDKKNALVQEFQYKRLLQANKKAQAQKRNQQKPANIEQPLSKKQQQKAPIAKPAQKPEIKNESVVQEKTSHVKEKSISESSPSPVVPKKAETTHLKQQQQVKIQKSNSKAEISSKKAEEIPLKKVEPPPVQVKELKDNQENYDSDDTEKLLESVESKPQKKQSIKAKEQLTVDAKTNKQSINSKQAQKYKESDGQYEQIQFDDQQPPKQKPKQQKKDKKEKSKSKKQPVATKQKTKQKSTKKLAPKVESDEQILYQNDKKQENQQGKAELKLIRQTLTYKFMAQGYTYEEFSNLVKQSGKKEFTVTEIMSVLSEEPFLLSEQYIQTMIIYLYETDNLTGQEPISNKNFMKKIKKFIGKAKPINEQLQNERINKLVSIVQADEGGKKKIRSLCKKYDSGDGSIDKDSFISVMKQVNVKGELLQTALAQIVYISGDINHLNYDFFLKRLTDN